MTAAGGPRRAGGCAGGAGGGVRGRGARRPGAAGGRGRGGGPAGGGLAVPRRAGRSRRRPGGPGVRAAWAWENRKASNRWYWAALAALCALGMAGSWYRYTSFRAEFDAQGTTWLAVWSQATLLPTMLFLPLLVAALTAQTAAGEHQGRNWQRMNANRLQGAMVAGKLLHMAQTALLTALVLLGEFIVTGLLLGFDPAELGPYAARLVPIALSVLVIEVFVAWLGVVMTSFASVMSTVLVATVAGCAATLIVPAVSALYPLSLMTAACAPRDPGSIDSMGSIALTSAIAAAWALAWTIALRRAASRVS